MGDYIQKLYEHMVTHRKPIPLLILKSLIIITSDIWLKESKTTPCKTSSCSAVVIMYDDIQSASEFMRITNNVLV